MSTNDITGDALRSKPTTEAYAQGWDRIFAKKPACEVPVEWTPEEEEAWTALATKQASVKP